MKTKNISGDLHVVVKHALPSVSGALKSLFSNITDEKDAKVGINFAESFGEISINGVDYQLQVHAVSNTSTWILGSDFAVYETAGNGDD